MTTLLLALKVLLATTAAPAFVDDCDDSVGLCSVIETDGTVHTVAREALPACAREGLWTYAGNCLDTSSTTTVLRATDDGADIRL